MDDIKPSARDRKQLGLHKTGTTDPMPVRRAMMEYIKANGPVRARDMGHLCGENYVPPINWLQREGYIYCSRAEKRGSLWSATASGLKWIAPVVGTPAALRTREFSGCATEAAETRWPDVSAGRMRAFGIQSRGMQ